MAGQLLDTFTLWILRIFHDASIFGEMGAAMLPLCILAYIYLVAESVHMKVLNLKTT